MRKLKWYTDEECGHTGLPLDGSEASTENDGVGMNLEFNQVPGRYTTMACKKV